MQLLFAYALQLGASRFAIGALNAIMATTIMACLTQVHGQGYAALGLYSPLVALGSVASVQVSGRLTDRWGREPEPPAC